MSRRDAEVALKELDGTIKFKTNFWNN
jgi:hypothetical protein